MKGGDTYRATSPLPGIDANRHLWIILSDPDQFSDEVLSVFMTSYKPRMDQTCILEVGDNPFITHKTMIAYGADLVWTHAERQQALTDGAIHMQEPVSAIVLSKVRELASYTPKLILGHQKIASKQRFSESSPSS